jgi:putative ribosome biogenesis GTPase RsgA
MLLLNKADLAEQWEIEPAREKQLAESGWRILHTSAKTGAAVEEAFTELTQAMTGK